MRQQIRDYFDNLDRQAQAKRGRIEYEASKVFRRFANHVLPDEDSLPSFCAQVRQEMIQAVEDLIHSVFREPMTINIDYDTVAHVEADGVRVDGFRLKSICVNDVAVMEYKG